VRLGKLPPQRCDLHVPVSYRPRDHPEHLIRGLHVVAPQRRRRPQQRYVGSGHLVDVVKVKGREIGGELGHLTAAAERNGDHPDDYRGGNDDQHHWHRKNRAMLGPMVGAAGGLSAAGTALLAVAGNAAEAAVAVRAGAALVDLGTAGPAAIAAFRAGHPGVLVCAACEQADLVHDPAVAARTGAILVCAGLAAAADAPVPRSQLLVDVPPAMLPRAIAAGYAALVDLRDGAARTPAHGPAARGPASGLAAGPIAIAAICAWLGAAVVRTSHPLQVRRALDMAESIRGTRPPARTVRGLA
jgi:dihydropteroate synthase